MDLEQKYKLFISSFTLGSIQVFQNADIVTVWIFNILGASLAAVLIDWTKQLLNKKVKPFIISSWFFLLKRGKELKRKIEEYIKNGL
jgi:hypothetical protein